MDAQVKMNLNARLYIELPEDEARALVMLGEYNATDLLRQVSQCCGQSYTRDHGNAFCRLMESVRKMRMRLLTIDKTRQALQKLTIKE